jgi:hypothetical protein
MWKDTQVKNVQTIEVEIVTKERVKPSKICLFRRLIVDRWHAVIDGFHSIRRFLLVSRVGEWRVDVGETLYSLHLKNEIDATDHVKAWQFIRNIMGDRRNG